MIRWRDVGSVTGTITNRRNDRATLRERYYGFDLILFDGAKTAEFNDVNGLVYFISSGALIATATELRFNLSANGPS